MENKYYTPKLEEFHVGFEYEKHDDRLATYRENNYEPTNWHKFKYDLKSIRLSQLPTHLFEKTIRVKYLDRSDIESLRWKQSRDSNTTEIEFELDLGNPLDNLGLQYDTENQYLRIHWFGQGDVTRFSGTIKNKSELKKLMKQLNIK
jgi:hypothetical protein